MQTSRSLKKGPWTGSSSQRPSERRPLGAPLNRRAQLQDGRWAVWKTFRRCHATPEAYAYRCDSRRVDPDTRTLIPKRRHENILTGRSCDALHTAIEPEDKSSASDCLSHSQPWTGQSRDSTRLEPTADDIPQIEIKLARATVPAQTVPRLNYQAGPLCRASTPDLPDFAWEEDVASGAGLTGTTSVGLPGVAGSPRINSTPYRTSPRRGVTIRRDAPRRCYTHGMQHGFRLNWADQGRDQLRAWRKHL